MIKKLLAFVGAAVVVTLALGITAASAHHPDVVATNVCVNGTPSIQVTASAWVTDWGDDHRVNHNVRIDVTGNGVNLTGSGAFAGPSYAFTRTFAVAGAEGKTLTVRATAVVPWGPNEEFGSAGTFSETTVTVANPCPVSTTTTTTTPPSTTAAPTTTVPTEVEAATETPPGDAGASVATQPNLAFTGSNTGPALLLGVLLLAGGIVLVRVGRRRTS
jgi:hypothetical protein